MPDPADDSSFQSPESANAHEAADSQPGSQAGLIAGIVGSLLILAVMLLPLFLGKGYQQDDLSAFHYPLREFYSRCLQQGHSFDWMPGLFAGFYVSGEGQLGAYHPLHWVLYRFFPVHIAFALELILSYPFMLVGTWLLMRRIVTRQDSAALGAIVFTFGSFNLLHFVHPNAIAVISHIPWLLLAIHVAAGDTGRMRIAATACVPLLTASQLLLGYPQYVWYSLLAQAAWACYFIGPKWRLYLELAGLNLVGLMMGAIQLVPTWDVMLGSDRSKVSLDFIMAYSWFPANLVQFFNPYLFERRVLGGSTHEFGMYVGAIPFLLVYWLLFRNRGGDAKDRRFVWSVAGFCAVAMLLAFGRFGGLAILQTWLPVVGRFRVPARALLLVNLGLAILSSIAVDQLLRSSERVPPRILQKLGWELAWLSGLVACAFLFLVPRHNSGLGSWPMIVSGPLLIVAGTAVCTLLARRKLWAPAIAILLTTLDLGVYGLTYCIAPELARSENAATAVPLPPGEPGDRIVIQAASFGARDGRFMGNYFISAGFTQVDGYSGLAPVSQLFGASATLPALQAAGVKWVCVSAAAPQDLGLMTINQYWAQVPNPVARIRMVTESMKPTSASIDMQTASGRTTALVERPVSIESRSAGHAQLDHEEPGSLSITTDAPTEQLLVLSDRYHTGWVADVDGHRATVLRVNGDFMGCFVPTGRHMVQWNFAPASLKLGWEITTAGAILFICWVASAAWLLSTPCRDVCTQ